MRRLQVQLHTHGFARWQSALAVLRAADARFAQATCRVIKYRVRLLVLSACCLTSKQAGSGRLPSALLYEVGSHAVGAHARHARTNPSVALSECACVVAAAGQLQARSACTLCITTVHCTCAAALAQLGRHTGLLLNARNISCIDDHPLCTGGTDVNPLTPHMTASCIGVSLAVGSRLMARIKMGHLPAVTCICSASSGVAKWAGASAVAAQGVKGAGDEVMLATKAAGLHGKAVQRLTLMMDRTAGGGACARSGVLQCTVASTVPSP